MRGVVIKPRGNVEIEPADTSQVVKAGEHWIEIQADLGGIAKELKEIDDRLHLRFNPTQEFYAIYAKEKGTEYLVSTFKSLDRRVTERIRKVMSSDYDYVKELDRVQEKKDKEFEYKQSQKVQENAEKLAWALRKDFEVKDRIYVSRDISDG